MYKEIANYSPEFGDLEVEVFSNNWYFKKTPTKRDSYSYNIWKSKSEDRTDYFWENIKNLFSEISETFDLILVIPKSNPYDSSITLNGLANRLSYEFEVPAENIIVRHILPTKKMSECHSMEDKISCHRGTFKLTRKLRKSEKRILLLDDIKTEGATKLFCAKLLKDAGAEVVKAIVLGINTTDETKSN
jgi:predicted amidophosphoribosyltransferase